MSNTTLLILTTGILLVLVLSSCSKKFASLPEAESTLATPVQADRIKANQYLLTNTLPYPFEVFLGRDRSADSPRTSMGTLAAGSLDAPSELKVDVDDATKRYYFTLVNDVDSIVVSERRLNLKGADNFRDLGGLPAADGKHIRWGLLYRADKLSELSKKDLNYVGGLNLKTVVDLRSEQEIAEAPDVLPKGATYVHLPIYNEAEDTADIKGQIMEGRFGVEDANNLLVEVNKLLASTEAHRFQQFIDLFVSGEDLPMVYHCTSGKDRTGFATYLILHTLGVDSAFIFDDYMMSNYYRYKRNKRNLRLANLGQYVKSINPEVIKPLMLVDPKYLNGAVDAIKEQHGTVEAFMEAEYGITDSIRMELRARYLY